MSAVQLFSEKVNSPQKEVLITDREIYNLLTQPDVKPNRKNFLIYQALKKEWNGGPNYNFADSVLVVAPQVSMGENGLIPFAMALKFQADPNIYVRQNKASSVHIVAFLLGLRERAKHDVLIDEKSLNDFLILLMLSGADLDMPYFKIKPGQRRFPNTKTVLTEIGERGYAPALFANNDFDPDTIKKSLEDHQYDKYRTMLDQMVSSQDSLETAELCIKFFSPSVFDVQTITRREHGARLINLAVRRYNKMAFDKLLSKSFLPSYFLVNEMLLEIRRSIDQKDTVTAEILQDMIIESADNGMELDIHQMNMAGYINAEFRSTLESHYSTPYWRKICRIRDGPAPLPLKTLAASLNLDVTTSKKSICDELDRAADTQRDEFIQASRKKQDEAYRSRLASVGDYINDSPENRTRLDQEITKSNLPDAISYNDYNIAVYRDEKGTIWFFDSGQFQSLLESKINPRTNAFLPEEFLTRIQGKVHMLESLGVLKPLSYESLDQAGVDQKIDAAYDRFQRGDRVSPTSNKVVLDKFYELGKRYNVDPSSYQYLTVTEMKKALPNSYNYLGLDELGDRGYVLVTVARIINESDSDVQRDFFSAVRSRTMSPLRDEDPNVPGTRRGTTTRTTIDVFEEDEGPRVVRRSSELWTSESD